MGPVGVELNHTAMKAMVTRVMATRATATSPWAAPTTVKTQHCWNLLEVTRGEDGGCWNDNNMTKPIISWQKNGEEWRAAFLISTVQQSSLNLVMFGLVSTG